MSVVVDYKGYYSPIAEVPSDIMDEWEQTLKGERARILSALTTKIPNADAFKSKIAEPAYTVWESFVSDTFPDVDLIKLKMRIKLLTAYDSWNTGVQNAFAEGGTFETNVTNKKDKFAKARYPMGVTGIRYKVGWLCGYKALGVITGDVRVLKYMGTDDSISGEVTNIFPSGVNKFVRALGLPIIVQGLVIAQYAHENGLDSERDAVISATNTKLDNTVEKLVNTGYTLDLKIGYEPTADRLFVQSTAESTS